MKTAAVSPKVPQRSTSQIVTDLLVLSRFHKYNPLLATFAGIWAVLLAGAGQLGKEPGSITTSFIFGQAALCWLSSYVFCGAGMVWNDWVDCAIDAQVERTKNRPLASGRITPVEGFSWMLVQVIASWWLVSVMLEGKNVPHAMVPVTISTILYPFGKRSFFRRLWIYPQYFLGFTLAYPSVIGWLAINGHRQSLNENLTQSLPLATTVFAWIFYLNTAYSYQDIVDDSKINVNSLYTLAGATYIHAFLVFLASLVLGSIFVQLRAHRSWWLWISWMCVWSLSLVRQLVRFDAKEPASGGPLHKENAALGLWTVIACMVELLLH